MTDKKNGLIPESNRVRMTKAKRKKAALLFYEKSMGNVSATCREIGITRQTFYRWLKEDPKFAEKATEVDESNVDFAETALLKNIKDGKETSLIFFLKTKGKSRGYIETVENNVTVNPFLELMQAATSEEDGE